MFWRKKKAFGPGATAKNLDGVFLSLIRVQGYGWYELESSEDIAHFVSYIAKDLPCYRSFVSDKVFQLFDEKILHQISISAKTDEGCLNTLNIIYTEPSWLVKRKCKKKWRNMVKEKIDQEVSNLLDLVFEETCRGCPGFWLF